MRGIFIVLMAILFSGCSLFENEQSIPTTMIGEWEWTLTSGGWGPSTSADTADYTMTLVIFSQNEAEWYQDDTLQQEFYIKEGNKNWQDGAFLMRSKSESTCSFRMRLVQENDQLYISSAQCTDQPTYYFIKVKN